jgi:hypothetical protein
MCRAGTIISPSLQVAGLANRVAGILRAVPDQHDDVVLACFLIEEDVRLSMCDNDAWILSQPCVDDLFDFDQAAGRARERSSEKLDLHGHG